LNDDSSETPGKLIGVEVAYATPQRQLIVALDVPAGTTAGEAIELSAIRREFPEVSDSPDIGIFSRRVTPEQELVAGDRVEIYRSLLADPKESRRARAELEKQQRKKNH